MKYNSVNSGKSIIVPLPFDGLEVIRNGLMALCAVTFAVLAVLLPRYDQRKTKLVDAYGYEFAMQNFAQGKWLLSDADIEARLAGEDLLTPQRIMYVSLGNGKWAFRKSPGYPLLSIPFQRLGWPRVTNAVLLVLASGALYFALKTWRGERFAFLGLLVFLFTPMTLRAAYFSTMDTFAAGALLVIAASLLLYYWSLAGKRPGARLALAAAGLAAGWGVVVRIHSLPILALLVVFALLKTRSCAAGDSGRLVREILAFVLGVAISLSVLLLYNQAVFGRPLATGYAFDSPYQELFLWESNTLTELGDKQLWYVNASPITFLTTIIEHLAAWLEPLLRGWPLLPLGFAALMLATVRRKTSAVHWLLFLWFAATYVLYAGIVYFGITFELTIPYFRGQGFFSVDRYLFPASLPIALLTTISLAGLRDDLANVLVLVFMIASIVSYSVFVL